MIQSKALFILTEGSFLNLNSFIMTYPEFTEIYNSNKDSVYAFAKIKLRGNHHDAEDIVSFVFMRLWEVQPTLSKCPPITSWLFTIAKRHIIDLLRRKSHYYVPITEEYPIADFNTVSFINNHLQLKEISRLSNKLSPKYKLVFNLHFFRELSPSEICKEIGANNQTVRNELSIIRKKFAKWV